MILQEAINQIYPEAVPLQDFSIRDDGEGQFIEYWNYNQPEPTEYELRSAWFNHLKLRKKNELSRICNQVILEGFTSSLNGHFYSFDQLDQMNFTQQMVLLVSNPELDSVDWKTEDAGVISHTKTEFQTIVGEADQHKRSNIGKYWSLVAQLEQTTSEEEIEAIQW